MDARTVGIRERKVGIYRQELIEQEGARKFPDARCSLENGAFTLPLEAGDNEVAVASEQLLRMGTDAAPA